MSLDSTLRSRINEIDQTNNVEARLESLEDGQSYLVQRTQDIKLLKDEILRELSGEVCNVDRYLRSSLCYRGLLLIFLFYIIFSSNKENLCFFEANLSRIGI